MRPAASRGPVEAPQPSSCPLLPLATSCCCNQRAPAG
ncbi:hypothetical protein LEMLEM_LOCUS21342 [Lemmus lemmus]